MLKSPSIRLAVNLCLIGALMLSHGGLGAVVASACEVTASGPEKCSGCGHCDVKCEGEHCGCCSKKHSEPATKHRHAAKKGCCHNSKKAPANTTPDSVEQQQSEPQGLSACLCGKGSKPAVPASEGRVEIEQIVKLAPKRISPTIPVDLDAAQRAARRSFEPVPISPHHSQRLLCIWLI